MTLPISGRDAAHSLDPRPSMVAAAVLAALFASGCCCSQEWRDKQDKERAAGDKEYVPFAKQLADVGRAVPAAPGEKHCDDAKIKAHTQAKHPSWSGSMGIVDQEHLAYLGGGPAPAEGWRALRTGTAGHLAPPGKGLENASNMRDLRREGYFGVVRTTVKQLPTGVDEKGFVGGRLDGFVIVYDVATMKPVCSAALKAHSSDVVKFKSRGLFRTDPAKAIQEDFSEQIHEQLAASMKRISEELKAAK